MILAGTGHRPDKLGGYSQDVFKRLLAVASDALGTYKPDVVISGMALGWDQALAQAAVDHNIPFIAAVPFEGQEMVWPDTSRLTYNLLLARAQERIVVNPGPYASWKMQARNVWMVDNADQILALWDGKPGGGTWNCIQYANQQNKPVINCWPAFAENPHYARS
jgi:uncharacterized phage-like protein YoqJ